MPAAAPFLMIPIDLLAALGYARLGGKAQAILRYGLSQVYGIGTRPRAMVLEQSRLAARLGEERQWAEKGVAELLRKGIIRKGAGRHEYLLEPDYRLWVAPAKRALLTAAQLRECRLAGEYMVSYRLGPDGTLPAGAGHVGGGVAPADPGADEASPAPAPPLPDRPHFRAEQFDFMATEPAELAASPPPLAPLEVEDGPPPTILPLLPAPRPLVAGAPEFDPDFVPIGATGFAAGAVHQADRARRDALARWAGPIFAERPEILRTALARESGHTFDEYLEALFELRAAAPALWRRGYFLGIVRRIASAGSNPATLAAAAAEVARATGAPAPPDSVTPTMADPFDAKLRAALATRYETPRETGS